MIEPDAMWKKWSDYLRYDDNGCINGIRKDTPPEIRDSIRNYLQKSRRLMDSMCGKDTEATEGTDDE